MKAHIHSAHRPLFRTTKAIKFRNIRVDVDSSLGNVNLSIQLRKLQSLSVKMWIEGEYAYCSKVTCSNPRKDVLRIHQKELEQLAWVCSSLTTFLLLINSRNACI